MFWSGKIKILTSYNFLKIARASWAYSNVAQCLSGLHGLLGSSPSTAKRQAKWPNIRSSRNGRLPEKSQQTNINISEEIIYFTLTITLNRHKFNRKLAFKTNTSMKQLYITIKFVYLFVCLFVCETGFLCVVLAVLELTLDQAGLELTDPPASASPSAVLGLKAWATTASSTHIFLNHLLISS